MPGVQVLRMDQDSTATKMAHEEIISRFAGKEANVLLGTQMVAKGHDIPDVTLVGILAADSTLNLPDFRASERGFSLLTQAAGRAGRGDMPGRVVLQTYDPENEIITLAAKQDYETFAKQELARRKEDSGVSNSKDRVRKGCRTYVRGANRGTGLSLLLSVRC